MAMDVPPMSAVFSHGALLAAVAQLGAGLVVGAVAGVCYFAALWRNVGLIDRGALGGALLLFAARFLLLAVVFFLLAKFSALALLAGAGGLLLARREMIRRLGALK
jgi:hypothetical protein